MPRRAEAEGIGVALCCRGFLDSILWIRPSGYDGRISDIISIFIFTGLFRVSRTLI